MKKVVSTLATRTACVHYWSDGTRTVTAEHVVMKVVTPQKEEAVTPTVKAAVNLGCIGDFWDKRVQEEKQ